ncbi:hypothetical protein ACJ41O_008231 [Fusarium nematophilum]
MPSQTYNTRSVVRLLPLSRLSILRQSIFLSVLPYDPAPPPRCLPPTASSPWPPPWGTASAAFQGLNYGATLTDGRVKAQSDFENESKTAASLEGTGGAFASARLYTMIQGGTPSQPISAIPAETPAPASGAQQLNSFAAVAVAILLGAAFL